MKEGISNGLNPTLSIRNGSPEYLRGNYLFDRSKYSDCFIITIDTTKAGSASNTFVLPCSGAGYDCTIIWGDGTSDYKNASIGNLTHIYPTPGIYQIKIRGTFPRIFFNGVGDYAKLISIDNWGTSVWTSMNNAFYSCTNMVGNYIDTPNTSNVTDMSDMFHNCTKFNSPVNFDTSNVTTMKNMFYGCTLFNQSVANFDTSKVIIMSNMFYQCYAFNQSVLNFNTANVINMAAMFCYNQSFNQPLTTWNTSNVTDMNQMFYMANGISIFNQSVANFDTSKVTNMSNMFSYCTHFNQSVANFDTSKVINMSNMFYNCTSLKQSLVNFKFNAATNISLLLGACNINTGSTTTNYDNTLVAWAASAPPSGLIFQANNCKYSDTGKAGRDILTGTYGWTITDGGHQ